MLELTVILSLISAVIGAVIGAAVTGISDRRLAKRQNRIQLTLKIFDEFHLEGMLTSRDSAMPLLIENCKSSKFPINILKDKISKDDFFHVSNVLHFMEKVTVLCQYKQLDHKMMTRLCGRYLAMWYIDCLEPQSIIEMKNNSEWVTLFNSIHQQKAKKLLEEKGLTVKQMTMTH